jgi:hypothetical protein
MSHPSIPSRRHWLRWAATGLVVLNLPGLTGCGGDDGVTDSSGGGDANGGGAEGGGSGGGGGNPPPPTSLGGIEAALTAITQLAASTPAFDAAAAAAALAGTGRFVRTGVDTPSQTAWARAADGRWLLVPVNDRSPARPNAAPASLPRSARLAVGRAAADGSNSRADRKRALAGGTDLPRLLVARQWRQLDMLGPIARFQVPHMVADAVDRDTLPNLRAIATGRGFDVVPITPDAAFEFSQQTTVEGLKGIRDDGLFFVNSFGGSGTDQNDSQIDTVSAIATTTLAFLRDSNGNPVADPTYEEDLAAGRLVQMVVPDLRSELPAYRAVLGITPDFGRFYGWTFAPNSLAWLNVTGGGIVGQWQGMLGARGAMTLVGWSQGVSMPQMLAVAEDFFHLTLATDRFDGSAARSLRRTPRLRNYGNGETLGFLVGQGLISQSELAYFPRSNPAEYVNVLTPTLDYASIDEDRETCELVGQFGAERDGSVLLSGSLNTFSEPLLQRATDPTVRFGDALRPETWMGDFVRVQLPRDRRGGYLQLRNDGRWTNVVQLTFWEVPITVRSTITGGLMYDLTVRLQLRGDLRGYRLRPDQPIDEQRLGVLLSRTLDTSMQWTASGSIDRTENQTTTRIEWSGSSSVAAAGPGGFVSVSANAHLRDRRMDLVLSLGAEGWRERTVVTRGGIVQSDQTVTRALALSFPLASLTGLTLSFDERWNLQPGSSRDSEPVSLLGDRMREVVVSWPSAQAAFPPEDDVGGR